MWLQRHIRLPKQRRGFHLITDDILQALPEIRDFRVGLLQLFLQHSSASIGINESYDPDVRRDMRSWADRSMPENASYYVHTLEGSDDMPAHLKSAVFGIDVTVPIGDGRLALGTWQGIWLGEHRDRGGERNIIATMHGEANQ